MPRLSSHFRLATLVLPRLGISSHKSFFLLGTTAPDAFEPDNEESFSQHHFRGQDERISLERFLQETNFCFEPSDNPAWSFSCGYYCHLWLDVFYRDNPDRLPFKKPAGMSNINLRNLIRRETEILNAPCVVEIGDLPIPQSEGLCLPVELKFVELNRCIDLFREVVRQSQEWLQPVPKLEAIAEAEYVMFFGEVSRVFVNEFQNAA